MRACFAKYLRTPRQHALYGKLGFLNLKDAAQVRNGKLAAQVGVRAWRDLVADRLAPLQSASGQESPVATCAAHSVVCSRMWN